MNASTIYLNQAAARESAEALRVVLSAARYQMSSVGSQPDCVGFIAKKKEAEIAVDWLVGSGLRISSSGALGEEIRWELIGLIAEARLPEDHVI